MTSVWESIIYDVEVAEYQELLSGDSPIQATAEGYDTDFGIGRTYTFYSDNGMVMPRIVYSFDTYGSALKIPSDATIKRVYVKVCGQMEMNFGDDINTIQLYDSNGNAHGTPNHFTSTSREIIEIDGESNWTISDLRRMTMQYRVGEYGGYIYGATLFVEYEVKSSKLHIKRNGTWVEAKKVYQKSAGKWNEISPEEIDMTRKYKQMV